MDGIVGQTDQTYNSLRPCQEIGISCHKLGQNDDFVSKYPSSAAAILKQTEEECQIYVRYTNTLIRCIKLIPAPSSPILRDNCEGTRWNWRSTTAERRSDRTSSATGLWTTGTHWHPKLQQHLPWQASRDIWDPCRRAKRDNSTKYTKYTK